MAIKVSENGRLFTLQTKDSSYQMFADDKNVLLHLKQEGLQFTGKTALVDRVLLGKTEFLYIRGSFFAVKTDPEICPGIIRIGFIVGADIWHQEKALSGG